MDQEYISKEAVLADLRLARSLTPGLPYEGLMAKIVDTFFDIIATYPAADVAPVKRVCSQCRWDASRPCHGSQDESDFCPNCGAKMY